jgi:Uma2 family endonuclease
MSTIAEMVIKVEVPDFPPDEWLLSEDGENLESDWHRLEIGLLVELMRQNFAGREDFFAGGNMFIYFNEEQARNKDFRGPDFFFVWGAKPMPLRSHWTIWKEGGRYPNVIIELLSASTAKLDRTIKKEIYEKTFRTPEYYCYDPDDRKLEGWRLASSVYQPIAPNEKGCMWSSQLNLWLGVWNGWYLDRDAPWLRFYSADGTIVPTREEADKVEIAKARKSAEEQHKLAEQQHHIAEEQRRRAEAAEAELARLQSQTEPK